MKLSKRRRAVGIGIICKRPRLLVALAILFFTTALFTARELIEPPSIEARIRIDIIDLDGEAEDVGSLTKPIPYDAESLESALFGEEGLDAPSVGSRRPDDTAWYDRLTIEVSGEEGEFIIRLSGDDAFQADEKLNGLLQAFTSRQNRRRAEQKTKAAFWLKQQRTAWQARIDEAKAAIVRNPFNPTLPRTSGQSESAKLLRLMIDATIAAQRVQQANHRDAAFESRPDKNGKGLAAETTRLADALQKLEVGRAAQLHHGTLLKEAEAGLTKLVRDRRELMGQEGVLDRPAVTISAPASARMASPLQYLRAAGWQILLPILAIASLIVASVATLFICRLWRPVEAASAGYLHDRHWPLPRNAHSDRST